jgi:hypothetical protein
MKLVFKPQVWRRSLKQANRTFSWKGYQERQIYGPQHLTYSDDFNVHD